MAALRNTTDGDCGDALVFCFDQPQNKCDEAPLSPKRLYREFHDYQQKHISNAMSYAPENIGRWVKAHFANGDEANEKNVDLVSSQSMGDGYFDTMRSLLLAQSGRDLSRVKKFADSMQQQMPDLWSIFTVESELTQGKGRSEGQAFHRRLLSEYNTTITLDNYVSYFELKPIVKDAEQLGKQINTRSAALQSAGNGDMVNLNDDAELKSLIERRHVCEENFFNQLHASFLKVKKYLWNLEQDLTARVSALRLLSQEEIRARPEEHILQIYVNIQSILQYRAMNLAAFRKIMKKFLDRCTRDSIDLQKRLFEVDKVISKSALSHPCLDLRRMALDIIALYGTVYGLTYEETVTNLSRYECLAGVNVRRILPHSDTFFFTLHFPHEERQGDFAVRILPGNTSLFCEKMISEVLQCERYPPCCSHHANGEINVMLTQTVRGDDVFVLQSLVKCAERGLSHSGACMELALMIHTAKLSSAARITAVIPYLAYSGVSSMAALAEILETMGCQHIITVDMLNEQVEGMFSIPLECISARYEFVRYIVNQLTNEGHAFDNITVVAPSCSAVKRAKEFADALMNYKKLSLENKFVTVCTAVHREVSTLPRCSSHFSLASERVSSTAMPAVPTTHHDSQVNSERPRLDKEAPNNTDKSEYHPHPLDHALLTPVTEAPRTTWAFELALRRQEEGIGAVRVKASPGALTMPENIVLVGDVRDRLCIIVDTSIDEAIDICQTARKIREEGAQRIILIATHFILSGGAVERLIDSPIDLVIVTDSIDQDTVFMNPLIAQKLRVLPLAPLLARAIEKMHTENSLRTLFEK